MRYFLYIAYDGTRYHGWQIQPNGLSVQEAIESALYTFVRKPVEVTGAGRTDAGVHARAAVAHIDLDASWTADLIKEKLNRILPPDIAISAVRKVIDTAHARFSAVRRTYHYHITYIKDPFRQKYAWRVQSPLNLEAMNEAAMLLLQVRDFTSFSKLHTDVKTNLCHVCEARWEQPDAERLVFTIRADRFLRGMVRAIVGTLVDVGRGKLLPHQILPIAARKDRGAASGAAPACGLSLDEVMYPDAIFIE